MSRSASNNRTFPLDVSGVFTGTAESTSEVAISVSIIVPTVCTVTIQQSYDKVNWFITKSYTIQPNEHQTVQEAVALEYFRVILQNQGIKQTYCHMISTLSQSLTQNMNIRDLTLARDSVNVDISGASITTNPLTPQTDGVSIYGRSLDGLTKIQPTVRSTTIGENTLTRMVVETMATMEETDIVSSIVGFARDDDDKYVPIQLKGTQAEGGLRELKTTDADAIAVLTSLEVNANKNSITSIVISTPMGIASGDDVGTYFDLGLGENRMRNVVFYGIVDASNVGFTDPKLIMSLSDNGVDFLSDGVYASYYKKSATEWQFCFQRSSIGMRYVRLVAENASFVTSCSITQSKN